MMCVTVTTIGSFDLRYRMNLCATALYGRDYQTLNVTRQPGTQGVDTRRRTASFNYKKAVKLLPIITNSVVTFTRILLPPANVVCEGYAFTRVCHSVHRGGGCYPSMHFRWYLSMPCGRCPGRVAGFQAHTQGEVEGDLAGGSPGPHPRGIWGGSGQEGLQAHTWGCLSQHALIQTPPWRLECWNAFLFHNAILFVDISNHAYITSHFIL